MKGREIARVEIMDVNIPIEKCINLKLNIQDYKIIYLSLSCYKHLLESRIFEVENKKASVDKLEEFKKCLADVEKVMKLLD